MKVEALALGFKHVESGAARPLELPRSRPGPGRRAEGSPPPQATLDADGRIVPGALAG